MAKLGSHWDFSSVKKVWLGGDGAAWVKAGTEYFKDSEYQLDKLHLKKKLQEALGHDEEGYEAVADAIANKNIDALKKALSDAEKRAGLKLLSDTIKNSPTKT